MGHAFVTVACHEYSENGTREQSRLPSSKIGRIWGIAGSLSYL
jgi:hypothetical protein